MYRKYNFIFKIRMHVELTYHFQVKLAVWKEESAFGFFFIL